MNKQSSETPIEPSLERLTQTWGIKEAAVYLHIHPDTVRKFAKERRIPGAKIGRAWVFMPHLLAGYLERQCRAEVRSADVSDGGSALAERLARARAQRTRHAP